MRAIVCRTLGPPSLLRFEDWPDPPPPGPEEVTVALAASGVNFVDLLMVGGNYQYRPDLPFIPGGEAAGEVVAVGRAVRDRRVGDRVTVRPRIGGFAERITLPAADTLAVPDGFSLEEGACFHSAYGTACHALLQGARLRPGETVLVHGAAGGMGHAAVRLAGLMGATVIATAGTAAKRDFLRSFGADHAIDHQGGRFRQAVKELTGGRGADVVFDPVGGDLFDESMRCINWGARLLIVGFTGGRPALARTNHLLIKGASAVGLRMGEFRRRDPRAARANTILLLDWAARGLVRPHISQRFPLAEAGAALDRLGDRDAIGRIVLTTGAAA